MIVYLIRNTRNGKGYVGQTTVPLHVRFSRHRHCHREDMPICVAMDEIGHKNFSIEVLQTCSSQPELNRAERAWIEKLGTIQPNGYNVSLGTGRRAETAGKISSKLKGRKITWGSKISSAIKGRKLSAQHRARISVSQIGKKASDEARMKMSVANGRRKLSDQNLLDIRSLYSTGALSQDEIAKKFEVSQTAVSRAIRGTTFKWGERN